jgi:hypothetical protein
MQWFKSISKIGVNVKKKVRYLTGAIWAAPALGGLAVPAVAATPATAAATTAAHYTGTAQAQSSSGFSSAVANGCKGTQGNHKTTSGTTIRFWSKPISGRTCIGTIQVSNPDAQGASPVAGSVVNSYGNFCSYGGYQKVNWGCHHVFRRRGLHMFGFVLGAEGGKFADVNSYYPFRHNGF